MAWNQVYVTYKTCGTRKANGRQLVDNSFKSIFYNKDFQISKKKGNYWNVLPGTLVDDK